MALSNFFMRGGGVGGGGVGGGGGGVRQKMVLILSLTNSHHICMLGIFTVMCKVTVT